MSRTQTIYNTFYQSYLKFAKMLTLEQRDGMDIEKYARVEANRKVSSLPKVIAAEGKAGMNK
jgi:tRNA A37 threonylcarbamoyltransferase TsaD